MKNVTVTVKDKNGEEIKISAEVEDEIAAWLSEKDEDFVREFIQAEKRMKNTERKETRRHQSLDKSIENGYDIVDDKANTEQQLIGADEREQFYRALCELTSSQRWAIYEHCIEGRGLQELATEKGVSFQAIAQLIERGKMRLKKNLKNF